MTVRFSQLWLIRESLIRLFLLACLSFFLAFSGQYANAQIFGKQRAYKLGDQPNAIAIADFNGDQLPDVVEVEARTGIARILLNHRNHGFTEASSYNVGVGAVHVATGDFNRDGIPDIAVVNAVTGSVYVLIGTGNGNFEDPQEYKAGPGAAFALVADVDRDGVQDLVVANAAGNSLTILKGTGHGTFSVFSIVSLTDANANPTAIAAVDFAGDGLLDLIVANAVGNSVTVLLGDGQGNFEVGQTYGVTCISPSVLSTSDFNDDGIPDLAIGCLSGRIEVLLGTGRGTFQHAGDYSAGLGHHSLQVADINADGLPDLVVNSFGNSSVAVLLGNEDGSFRAPIHYSAGRGPKSIAIADFNQDGRLDLAVANSKSSDMGILLNVLEPTSTSLESGSSASGSNSVTARVSSLSGSATGSVLFRSGRKTLGKTSLDQTGSAALELRDGTPASAIRATYLGDMNHLGSSAMMGSEVNAPVALLSPSPVSFPTQAVGVSSSIVVTVKNTGNTSLTISSITLSGTNATGFSKTTTCKLNVALAAGASCKVTVSSLPTSAGAKSAALTLVDDDPTSPQVDNITANAVDAAFIAIVPSPAKFPPQGVGVPSALLNATLTNLGDMPLSIAGMTISGAAASNYSVVNNCPANVPAGASCTIPIQFTPSTTGTRSAVVKLTSNALISPLKLTLTGTGINGANAVVSPAALAFGAQGVAIASTQVLTVSNTGNAVLTIGPISIGGTNPGDFTYQTNSCASIAVGQSCTIVVTFTPPLTGARSATLSIGTNANLLAPVSMKGTGVNGPVAQLQPTSLNFGSETTGQTSTAQKITLTNTGNASLAITGFVVGGTNGADFLQTNNCPTSPSTIAVGGNCVISVTFTPAAVGPRTGTLTINDNGVPNPQKVALSGTGILPSGGPSIAVLLSPASILTFASASGTVTISSPAPAGGQQVFLSASNPGLIKLLPTSVTVAAGQTTAAFSFSSLSLSGAEVITGFASGFTSGTANLAINSRQSTLLPASPLIGVGRSVSATLTLANPAPSGGTTFNLASVNSTVASISPATVSVPEGSTTTTTAIQVSGLMMGATSVNASAAGYTASSANVTITNSLINLGKNITVAPGQSLPLPVALAQVAPVGGITVNLSSNNTGVVSVSPASVFIAAGQTTPASLPLVTGVAFGVAAITGSDASSQYAPDSSSITVSITLTFAPPSLSINAGTTANLTLSVSAPAPAGGYTANITVANTAIATAPATVQFAAGASSALLPVTGVAAGNTTVQATISGAPSASAAITVNPPPAITLNAVTVGKNLEVGAAGSLAAPAPAGNLNVTLTSLAPTRVLLSPDAVTTGSSSIVVQAPAGASTIQFYVQGLAGSGTATVTASAPGYANGSAVVTLNPSGFYFATPPIGTAVGLPDSTVVVSPALLTPSTLIIAQAPASLRAGISASISVNSSQVGVGTIIGSPVVLAGGNSSASVSFHPVANGTTNVSVVQPTGYSKPATQTSITATVSGNAFSVGNSLTLGANLQTPIGAALTSPAPAGNLTVTVSSSDITRVLLSTDPTISGSGSIDLQVPAGSTAVPSFYVQALTLTGNVNVQMQAPGVATGTIGVSVVPSGFVVVAACDQTTFSTNDVSGDTSIYVLPEVLDPNTLQPTFVNIAPGCGALSQTLSPAVGPVSVNVTSGTPTVGTILTSPVSFNTNDGLKTTTFHPIAVGSSNVTIDAPAGFATPAANQQVVGTVTLSNIFLSTSSTGKDLQAQLGISLGAAAPPGNEQVTVTSADPSQVLLTTDPTVAGASSVSVVVFAGSSQPSVPVYAQALNNTGTVNITASSPSFGSVTTPIQLVPSGFVIASTCAASPISTTPLSADTPVAAYAVALDPSTLNDTDLISGCYPRGLPLRFGAGSVTVNITTADPSVGTITTSPVTFNPGDASQSTAFHPVAVGNTNVNLSPVTGFSTPANYQQIAAAVANGTISLSVPDLGKNLENVVGVSLSTAAPNGETIILTSGDPAKLLLSTDPTVLGSSTVSVSVPPNGGSSNTSVYAQALEGAGTVSVTASSADYSSASVQVNLLPSGFVVAVNPCVTTTSFSTTPLSQDVGLTVYVTPLDPQTLNDTNIVSGCYQSLVLLSPSAGVVTIPITSSSPGIGTITATPLTFNPGDTSQASAFRALANGSSTVALGSPSVGGFSTPSNYQTLAATVTNGSISMSVGTANQVGQNLEAPVGVSLSLPAPASGDTVIITSSNPSQLVLSTDPTVLGSGSVSIPVLPGSSSVATFYAQALVGTGSVNLTASATNFDPQTLTVALVPSGFVLWTVPCNIGNNPISTSVLGGDSAMAVYSVALDPTTLNLTDINGSTCLPNAQALRPGVPNASVNVTSSNTAAGTVTNSPTVFTTNQMSQTTGFHPIANGSTNVSVSTPTGFNTPSNYQQTTYNVVPAPIYVSPIWVGKNMQVSATVGLGVAAPSAGLTVTVTSANANVLLSTSPTVLGSTSLNFNLNQGDTSTPSFYVQARFAAPTAVTYQASAPGYAATSATITVLPSGFVIQGAGISFTTQVGSPDVTLQIAPAALDSATLNLYDYETLLPGSTNTQVQVLTSASCGGSLDQSVGQITLSPVVFNGADVPDYQNTSFHAVATGSTVVYVPAPAAYSRASNNNCVTANVN